ncbi:MAG: hypothetical protein F6K17_19770 [Okeania sp. SIO3C4]|nr:hypothetical protein [Okeania sp. SIO3B3]NER04682.1 hypothetical protein [Okeania sp. SIO3C4]
MSKLVRNKKGQVMTVLGEGEKPKAEKPLSVRVQQDIDEYVRSLPNRSQWLEEAITEKARKEMHKYSMG